MAPAQSKNEKRRLKAKHLRDFIFKPPYGQAAPEENPLVGVGVRKSQQDDCRSL